MSLSRLQIPYMTTAQRNACTPNANDVLLDITLNKIYLGDGVTVGGILLNPGASITFRGNYDGGTAYSPLDMVYYSITGSSYVCKLSSTGNDPTNSTYWGVCLSNVATPMQVELDFGSTPVQEASFVVTDAGITPSSYVVAQLAYVAPTGKELDECDMDSFQISCSAGSGNFTMYIKARDGYVADKFKFNYYHS